MKNYIAIVTEENSPLKGQIFASTKGNLIYKGMNKDEFFNDVELKQCYSFEVREIETVFLDKSKRRILN